ncbi:MAG TPA: SMC family ATPase [Methanotrichaceae archaeon]|nr:SMC family ATPase [Methanotrichaceae archaeon]HQF16312.1 SMC family ATPase [Methanotrichaceae archaeon]HQI90084.1 SMC family ATPase [Methanotrichaceae archaeon]HQJ27893.1 SMC family ATPase [Methanotrichaceae archaeon]
MRLSKLVLRNFKKYRRADIRFQDGLTGILGGNGAGKSTIVEAIAWALYGSRASTIKRDFLKNVHAQQTEPVEVQLTLGLGGQELVVYRAMKGKGMVPDAHLRLDGQVVARGSREVDSQLERMIRISFPDFMKTYYARQKDLDNLLREGGSGKREYLLKLLGLDQVRELVLERIRNDQRTVLDRHNQVAGALAELDGVGADLISVREQMKRACQTLASAEETKRAADAEMERQSLELEREAERRRTHNLLEDMLAGLRNSALEKETAVKREMEAQARIAAAKEELGRLTGDLGRLEQIREALLEMEPLRRRFEELLRQLSVSKAETGAARRSLQEGQKRLAYLLAEREDMEQLAEGEEEFNRLGLCQKEQEEKRDRHQILLTKRDHQAARQSAAGSGLARVQAAWQELVLIQDRAAQLAPVAARHKEILQQLEDMKLDEEVEKRRQLLKERANAVTARRGRISERRARIGSALSELGDLEEEERLLLEQDRLLDGLIREQSDRLAELRSQYGLAASRLAEARDASQKIEDLGSSSVCPTCQRPLGEHRQVLLKRYREDCQNASSTASNIKAMSDDIQSQMEAAAKTRSSLREAFDRISRNRAEREAMLAEDRQLFEQEKEADRELAQTEEAISGLGPARFDPLEKRLLSDQASQLAHDAEEFGKLVSQVQAMPALAKERESLEQEMSAAAQALASLDKEIGDLGFSEEAYQAIKRRLGDLWPVHEKYRALRERTSDIPDLSHRLQEMEDELASRLAEEEKLSLSVSALAFDPEQHDRMAAEARSMTHLEAQASKLRILVAGEVEAKFRLEESLASQSALMMEMQSRQTQLAELDFREERYAFLAASVQAAAAAQADSRKAVELARIDQNVLHNQQMRLEQDRARQRDLHAEEEKLEMRMQILETARELMIRFLDRLLVVVRDEVASIAGQILEEVSDRYSLVRIDENFEIMVEDGGEYYPISRFSGGEIDMIAVSVRIAISEYLMRFGGRTDSYSFLVLDEIFGSQDLEHRERMINMLRRLEGRFPQIFAISHIGDVQGQFDNSINVMEDGSGNSIVEVQ